MTWNFHYEYNFWFIMLRNLVCIYAENLYNLVIAIIE